MASYFPAAKLGNGNYIYVYNNNGSNYYQISAVNFLFLGIDPVAYTAISVAQAYNIDNKIDDGLPLSGNVTTVYFTGYLSTGLGNALGGTIAIQGYISGTGWGGAIGRLLSPLQSLAMIMVAMPQTQCNTQLPKIMELA